jgi:3-oxoacyl-[acyl-carrier protein] reductase
VSVQVTGAFAGARVVVTGAGGIFGRRIAAAFARAGARLCLSDPRPEVLDQLPGELGLSPDATLLHVTELREDDSILDLVRLVERAWGAPDILINNAGVYPRGQLLDIPADEWDRIMDVNLRAPFLLTREIARLMIRAGVQGSVVNITSGAARTLRTGSVPYGTSKAALERLTAGLALELAPHRIRVNAVSPGFAPGSTVSPLSPAYVDAMLARIPLGRSSGPDDAPNAILFLCSENASFITGATLAVDGGNSLGTVDPSPGSIGGPPGGPAASPTG